MPRSARIAPGGVIFHCLNRGNDRRELFADDAAFEWVLESALEAVSVRLLAYCLMPNHWHLPLGPRKSRELARFMQRLTTTNVRRWHTHWHSEGRGHLYQRTFKSFPGQDDLHFPVAARYVERNALVRARSTSSGQALVERAEGWRWGSLWRRERCPPQERGLMSGWPVQRPTGTLAPHEVKTP
jgi:putative transposase